jgi:hypothetical protein
MPGPGALTAGMLLIVALAAALTTDVVKTLFGVKGDEATYVSMALSLAYDYDLAYERRDLDRFTAIYRSGPEGIFLKTGRRLRIRFRAAPPFVTVAHLNDLRTDRLYFGKALIYPVVAAPFVRLFGMNGFLIFHVLLLFGAGACGYCFLVARAQPAAALVFTLAFLGAAAVPVWAAFLTSDLFNFVLVFVAYFLWLYKEVARSEQPAPPPRVFQPGEVEQGFIAGRTRADFPRGLLGDLSASVLLGAVTYSKLSNGALVLPLIVLSVMRRQLARGVIIGAVWAATAAALFGINTLVSGDFNYQGGDRKIFYGKFPFDAPDATWERRGIRMTTNRDEAQDVLERIDPLGRFGENIKYFLIGRHFGFVPYFFPGVVAIALWLRSGARRDLWPGAIFVTIVASALLLLFIFPYTWSGGGGPPGNRYFLSLYPALFFLVPPLASPWPGLVAWAGGALFTAKMLVNPFVAAKFTYETTERGFARRLPVEVTMANDLPVMLDSLRTHIWFSDVLLYFLDRHAYVPEVVEPPDGRAIWIAGDGRADILVRSEWPIDHLTVTAETRIPTTFRVSMGGAESRIPMLPGKPVTFDVGAAGVRGLNSYAYLLSASSSDGFTPHLLDPGSDDYRNLGVMMRFKAVPVNDLPDRLGGR